MRREVVDAAAKASGWVDHSDEVMPSASAFLRFLFRAMGIIAVVFAGIGVILPGWPTTVWLIVATYFFGRSSPRFYNAIMNNRIFGPLVRDYHSGLGIPRRAKILAIGMMALFAGTSAVFLIRPQSVRILVGSLGALGIAYVSRLPTRRANDDEGSTRG